MAEEANDPLYKDDDSIPEDPERVVNQNESVGKAFGMALVSLISKRFTLSMMILMATMIMGFAIIFLVPEGRIQIAMTIFAYIAGFASAAVMFYLGNHNQAVQASLQAQMEEIQKAAQK